MLAFSMHKTTYISINCLTIEVDFMEIDLYSDNYFMKQAFKEALLAQEKGEVPIGAVIVSDNRIIARGHNQVESLQDATAHAEMIAITSAMSFLGTKYLRGCSLYVTMEPCAMCAGALSWAKLDRVVYGAEDSIKGFMKYGKELLHPKTKLEFGVMANECSQLVKSFFTKKRLMKEV